MRTLWLGLLLLPFAVATLLAQDGRRAMSVDDGLEMTEIEDALMSPDGEWVFYSQSELDWKENKRQTKYYMVAASGDEAFQYIGEAGGSQFEFSPDGRYLSFVRPIDDKKQLFHMRVAGGEAIQLTEHETGIGRYKWSPDAKKIFFAAEDERPKEEREALKKGGDALFVDEGPNGQTRANWTNLWMIDLDSRDETRLTDERFIVSDFDIAPQVDRLVLAARYSNRRNDADRIEIFLLDLETKTKTRLTDNATPEGGLQWAPDGKRFLFQAADDTEWMNRNTKLYLMDPQLREHGLISGAYEGDIFNAVWSPDGSTVLFNGLQGTDTNLYRLDITSGRYQQLTDVRGTLRAASFSTDRDKMVYSFSDFDTPDDLFTSKVESFEPKRLTTANPMVENELLLADMRLVRWQSKDDFEIEGLLHLPRDRQERERLPLILNIHGGPAGVFRNSFRASYHIYAGLGYASLSPNVRGSSGYTDHLREGNTVAKGDGIGLGDYWDLIHGVDLLIEQGIADRDKIALRGWSYGGILGGWTITQTDRFKAASIGAGVYDWASEYGPGFNHDVRLWHIGGTPWDNPEGYRHQSALTHVRNVTTPTILFHGEEDRTDTEQQSMMFFTAIKDIGAAPVRYIKFPRQGHGIREPRHQRIRDIEEIRWMQKHVLGVDWTPWERQQDEDEGEDDEKEEVAGRRR